MLEKKWLTKCCAICSALFLLINATQVLGKKMATRKSIEQVLVNPGKCTLPDGTVAPDISTQAKLIGLDGEWSMSMETFGTNSVGSWFINFTKNGEGEPSTQHEFNPPGGWATVGSRIEKSEAKGNYEFTAKATKRSDPIIVCEASIMNKK